MKKCILSSIIITLLTLVIALFFDLEIAEYIYNPKSVFAKIFSVAGMMPQAALLILPPAMMLAVIFEKRREIKIQYIIITVAALLLVSAVNFYSTVQDARQETGLSIIVIIAIIIFFIFIFFMAALPFAKKNAKELLITALIGFTAFTFGYWLLQIIKTYWGRQRFFSMDNAAEQFTKWYLPQGKAVSDNFKSFPSGHCFSAMCAVWFALWPRFIHGLKKYTRLIFFFALLFGFAVMLSRMIYGRHFLSDVTAGAALSLASFALARTIICNNIEKVILKIRRPDIH
ncbi:MAG: phosphatase PAP2 family protein [Spirochaetaceae bacterium]|jgi:membrane-associated phospholipid phosphatase|nr:phosphatase PAP2 family protein [Spirochaetaceae bacterium]